MNYWDQEMLSEKARLEALPARLRLKVATQVLSWTVGSINPPIQDANIAEFVHDGIAKCESAVARGSSFVDEGVEEMVPLYKELFESSSEPGADQFMTAVIICFARIDSEIPVRSVLNVLSDAYEGVLLRTARGRITPEVERSNPPSIEAIAFQKAAIDRAEREA